jgi:hypothetical protein
MTIDEVSTLLDSKLGPMARDVADVKRHLFGNGNRGLSERISLLEQTCAARGQERERHGRTRWEFIIAVIGWAVTLGVVAVEKWPR